MRTLPIVLWVAVLIAALLLGAEWLATTATVAPASCHDASEAPGEAACAAHQQPPTASTARVDVVVGTDRTFADEPFVAAEPVLAAKPEQPRASCPTAPAGVLVVDGARVPQPDLPVGLCTSERLSGRPCILPLGRTDAQGFLALPPHRVGVLVVDTAGGRLGSVARSAAMAATTVHLVLHASGGLLVDVVDAAGRAIEGARVELVGAVGNETLCSDAAGRAAFPHLALDHELTLRTSSAGRCAELRLPAHRPAGRTLHQVVVLDAAPVLLRTAVLDGDGAPFGERLVRCTFADGRSLRTTSDAHGGITIPLPAPANGKSPTSLDLRLELLDAAGRLCGASALVNLTPNDGATALPPVRLQNPAAEPSRGDAKHLRFERIGRSPHRSSRT